MKPEYINVWALIGNLLAYIVWVTLLKAVEISLCKKGFSLHFKFVYFVLAVITILAILGYTVFWEYWLLLYKRAAHFLNTFLCAYIFDQVFSQYLRIKEIKLNKALYLWVLFASVSTLGVFDEILDLIMGSIHWKNDSATDLLVNTIGLLTFVVLKMITEKLTRGGDRNGRYGTKLPTTIA